jgi:cytochrome c biogenesis protein CcdA
MEDPTKSIESLIEKVTDFSKTSYELAKLKTLDKSSDVASSMIPHSIVFVLFASFMLFANFGLAYWLGEVLGNTYYGFFVVAGFYVITGLVLHFFFHKRIKNFIWNSIIKQVLK